MKFLSLVFALALGASVLTAAETKYAIDPAHTSVGFSVSHMVISTVSGNFKDISGTLVSTGDDFTNAKIDVSIKTASITTDNDKRDEHLRSADFFDAAKFPEAGFKSSSIVKTGKDTYVIKGNLTLHGVTKPVELKTTYKGSVKSPWGQTVAAFKATTTIDRKNWGLVWNKTMEAGGVLVGEDVELSLNVELVKQ